MNITITLLMKVFQKDAMATAYSFITKTILTTKKELAIDKMLLNTDFEHRNIYIIWWNNCKYRVLTTLNCGQAQMLMEKDKLKDMAI